MNVEGQPRWPAVVKVVLLIEWAALLIALATPLTPSKTGGGKLGLAKYFVDNPSYLQDVLIGFVFVNVLVGLLALAFWIYLRWNRPGD
jgi:hypothetical protein